MKKILVVAGVLLFAAAACASNDPTRISSDPALPSHEALDRLNLEMAWAVYVPMDGKRDAFASIQLDGDQIIAQTRSGLITVLDAENGGRALWRSRPGRAYEAVLPPAINSQGVFANDSGGVYGLDRVTGSLLWKYGFRVALSAPLSVDERQVYIENVEARLIAARLPQKAKPAPAATTTPGPNPPPTAEKTPDQPAPSVNLSVEDVRPLIAFDFDTSARVETKAVLSKDSIFLAIPDGSYLGVPKTGDAALGNTELYRYVGDSRFSAPPGHSDAIVYLATSDSHLYAVAIDTGVVKWRYFPGRPITRQPISVDVGDDKDLYVTAVDKGMARLNRDTGEPVWKIRRDDYSPDADRFLAANPKFVYATDGTGRMLILDRKNGAVLTRYDVHDYVVPVINAETDRIYLAANNGLIVCLHDKEYAHALAYHKIEAPVVGKSLKERTKELMDTLAKPISDPGGEMMTFKAYREKLHKDYGVKMYVSDKSFKDQMVPPPDEQMIQTPKVDNKPLGDVLTDVVGQVKGEYTPIDDTLVVSPAKMK